MELIIDAQRATFAGSSEFKAAAAQVNANSATLTQAMGAIVGPKKAAEFQTCGPTTSRGCWPTAPRSPATTRPQRPRPPEPGGFAARLALYFSDIVRNELPVEALTDVLSVHDKHLIEQVNAYAANDYAKAQEMQLEGYQQMLGVANTLVGAIQKTVKPGCRSAVSTGGGGAQRRDDVEQTWVGGRGGRPGPAGRLLRSAHPADPAAPVASQTPDRAASPEAGPSTQWAGRRPRLPLGTRLPGDTLPVRIIIPKIGVASSLDRLGRAPDGTVEVPGPDWGGARLV